MACYKLAFSSPEQAERTAAIIQAQGLRDPSTAPRRVYLCPKCDRWHWTSQPYSHDGAESVAFQIAPLNHKESACRSVNASPASGPSSAPGPTSAERAVSAATASSAEACSGTIRPSTPSEASTSPAPSTPSTKPGHVEILRAVTTKMQRLETNLTWAKDNLRPALSRWIRERSDDAAIELAVVVDMVVGLPKTAKLNDPIVRANREAHAAEKRTWLRYHRQPTVPDDDGSAARSAQEGTQT